MDVDQNGIIDINDQKYISDYLLGSNDGGTTQSKDTSSLPSHSTKYYYEYDATSGKQIGNKYAVEDVKNISMSSSKMIIDDGIDRKKDYSKSGVVKLSYLKNGSSYVATGFVVDKNKILTSAHCVYETSNNAPVTKLKYTVYNSDGTVKNTYTAKSYHVPEEYQNENSYGTNGYLYDYALIEVNEDLSDYMIFDLGVARNYITTKNPKLYVTGYSGEPISENKLLDKMATGYGYLTSSKIDNKNIYYTTDTVGGESGGPLYLEDSNGNLIVIGINSGENKVNIYNLAKRIDTDILNFVYNNSRLD